MAACAGYGKLYAYFLEVCRREIYRRIPSPDFPEDGQEMYEYLDQQISDGWSMSFKDFIEKEHLPRHKRKPFLHQDRIIDVTALDVSMYFTIIKILGGNVGSNFVRIRNHLCHIPMTFLQIEMSSRSFEKELNSMKRSLQADDVDPTMFDNVVYTVNRNTGIPYPIF